MDVQAAACWQTLIQAINLLVLIITAGILVWYTKETYRLRKESERQTELMLRPFVIAEFALIKAAVNRVVFKVHNIGNSAATNIQITSLSEKWIIEIPFLANGVSRTYDVVPPRGTPESGLSPSGTLLILNAALINDILKIEFENADRQKYFVSEAVTLTWLKITESGKLES